MFERLFGSASRSKIIKFFCEHVSKQYYMRELARLLDIKLNALSRELENLESLGFIKSSVEQNKKYFETDTDFPLLGELTSIIEKSKQLLERQLVANLQNMQGVQLAVLTGIFVDEDTGTDVLVVGSVNRTKVQRMISKHSGLFFQDIRFTLLTTQELSHRMNVTDKFIFKIMNATPIVAVDNRR